MSTVATKTEETHTKRRFTVEEYLHLAKSGFLGEEHTELIDGEIYMAPPTGPEHSSRNALLRDLLVKAFSDGFYILQQQPIHLSSSLPEPDVAVAEGNANQYLHDHPRQPLLVAEVSVTSLGFDRGLKLQTYAAASIPEYWILNLQECCLEVYTEPTQTPEPQYKVIRKFFAGDAVSPTAKPDAVIQISDLLP